MIIWWSVRMCERVLKHISPTAWCAVLFTASSSLNKSLLLHFNYSNPFQLGLNGQKGISVCLCVCEEDSTVFLNDTQLNMFIVYIRIYIKQKWLNAHLGCSVDCSNKSLLPRWPRDEQLIKYSEKCHFYHCICFGFVFGVFYFTEPVVFCVNSYCHWCVLCHSISEWRLLEWDVDVMCFYAMRISITKLDAKGNCQFLLKWDTFVWQCIYV